MYTLIGGHRAEKFENYWFKPNVNLGHDKSATMRFHSSKNTDFEPFNDGNALDGEERNVKSLNTKTYSTARVKDRVVCLRNEKFSEFLQKVSLTTTNL